MKARAIWVRMLLVVVVGLGAVAFGGFVDKGPRAVDLTVVGGVAA